MYLSYVRIENRYSALTLLCWILWILPSCQKAGEDELPEQANLEFHFHPLMQGTPISFDQTYTLPNGERFEPRVFKFYSGQITGQKVGGGTINSSGDPYYLADAAQPASLIIKTRIPAGSYQSFQFLLGVDSARNVSGVQSGALYPLQGMFWTWNSGYIFAKLEGRSPDATTPNNMVEYHIGGFRVPYNAAQTISLPVAGTAQLKAGQTLVVDIDVELEKWFTGPYPLSIASNAVSMTPGELAWNISRNFSGLFTVTQSSVEE